jgi:hypothetical protein
VGLAARPAESEYLRPSDATSAWPSHAATNASAAGAPRNSTRATEWRTAPRRLRPAYTALCSTSASRPRSSGASASDGAAGGSPPHDDLGRRRDGAAAARPRLGPRRRRALLRRRSLRRQRRRSRRSARRRGGGPSPRLARPRCGGGAPRDLGAGGPSRRLRLQLRRGRRMGAWRGRIPRGRTRAAASRSFLSSARFVHILFYSILF